MGGWGDGEKSNLYFRLLPFALHPSPFAFSPSPFALHPSPFAFSPSPFALRPSPFTLRLSPFPLRPSPFAFRPSPMPNFNQAILKVIYHLFLLLNREFWKHRQGQNLVTDLLDYRQMTWLIA